MLRDGFEQVKGIENDMTLIHGAADTNLYNY